MQNRKAYFIADLAVFGLTAAFAPTSPRPAISANATPALAALSYSWKTDYAGALIPPVEIQQKAHAACIQREFERAFMTSISFEQDHAIAVFSCRGAAY